MRFNTGLRSSQRQQMASAERRRDHGSGRCRPYCVDNHPDRLDAAVAVLGQQAHGRLCDALDQGQVDEVVDGAVRDFAWIDILVNAVGGSTIISRPSAPIEDHSLDDWQGVIKFNLDGTFLFTHAVVPVMKRQRLGKIVNLHRSPAGA